MLPILLLLTVGLTAPARCDRGAPEPVSFVARGFGRVAEIFPAHSRQNAGALPFAYFYEMGYPGTEWKVDPRRVWTGELATPQMPQAAIVSMAGHLVTLDDYYGAGGEHALVIYDLGGHLVRSFSLDELLGTADLARVTISDCGRLWREGTNFYFTEDSASPHLYVSLPWGRVLELSLTSGELRQGSASDFPDLRAILAREFPNEEAEVWSTSLRFSSVTDTYRP